MRVCNKKNRSHTQHTTNTKSHRHRRTHNHKHTNTERPRATAQRPPNNRSRRRRPQHVCETNQMHLARRNCGAHRAAPITATPRPQGANVLMSRCVCVCVCACVCVRLSLSLSVCVCSRGDAARRGRRAAREHGPPPSVICYEMSQCYAVCVCVCVQQR